MKKFIYIFLSMFIFGVSSSAAIGCDNQTPRLSNREYAQNILNKIVITNLTLPAGSPTKISNSIVQSDLKNALKSANPSLTEEELKNIYFIDSGSLLSSLSPTLVTTTVNINGIQLSKNVTVTLNPTKGESVMNEIVNQKTNFYLKGEGKKDLTLESTRIDIFKSIFVQIPKLASEYTEKQLADASVFKNISSNISAADSNYLIQGQINRLQFVVNFESKPLLPLLIPFSYPYLIYFNYSNPSDFEQDLIYKITNFNIEIPFLEKRMAVTKDNEIIKKALLVSNPYFLADEHAQDDLSKIEFNSSSGGAPLYINPSPASPVQIGFTISSQLNASIPAPGVFKYYLYVSAAPNPAQLVINKIKSNIIYLSKNTIPNINNQTTILELKNNLKTTYPALNKTDLDTLEFSLKDGETWNLTGLTEINVSSFVDGFPKVSTVISVKIELSDANLIADKIRNRSIVLPKGTDPQLQPNTNTGQEFLNMLQLYNPSLTNDDLKFISFSTVNVSLSAYTVIPIQITGNNPGDLQSINLEVRIAPDVKTFIQNKFVVKDIYVQGNLEPSVNGQTTKSAIIKSIKDANPALTNEELLKATFKSAFLIADNPTPVVITFSFDVEAKFSVSLNIIWKT